MRARGVCDRRDRRTAACTDASCSRRASRRCNRPARRSECRVAACRIAVEHRAGPWKHRRTTNTREEAVQLNRDDLLQAYRAMRTIREFEERAACRIRHRRNPGLRPSLCRRGSLRRRRLHAPDRPRPHRQTHRGHGHCIAKGCDVDGMMAEIYGRRDGAVRRQGRLDAHRRPVQGHDGRQWHRRRRCRRCSAAPRSPPSSRRPAASASPSSATAPPTRAPCSKV